MSGKFCWLFVVAVLFFGTILAAEENNHVNLANPTPQQARWQEYEIGMFIHFAPNTWLNKEYDDLSLPLEKMDLSKLDTDQWVTAAEAMGAKYIVFVAKHVGGFCMWQTETTNYGVKSLSWRGGKGDVLADLATSCRKRGIKLGVYLSPWRCTTSRSATAPCCY
jgi:alpha-L-fucosidase